MNASALSTVAQSATKPAAACSQHKPLNPKKFHGPRVNDPVMILHPYQPAQTAITRAKTSTLQNRSSVAAEPSADKRQQSGVTTTEGSQGRAHISVERKFQRGVRSLSDAVKKLRLRAGRAGTGRRKGSKKGRRPIYAVQRREGQGSRGNADFRMFSPGSPTHPSADGRAGPVRKAKRLPEGIEDATRQ